jgi:hypothetical protein
LPLPAGDLLEVNAQEAGMGPQRVVLLDADAGRPLGDALQLPNPALVLRLVVGPDGQHLASVTQSSTIVWIAAPHLWLRRSCAQLAIGIDAMQWQRRLAGVAYPKACL